MAGAGLAAAYLAAFAPGWLPGWAAALWAGVVAAAVTVFGQDASAWLTRKRPALGRALWRRGAGAGLAVADDGCDPEGDGRP